ncbi:MAG TPA: hypothetical protein VIM03_09250 [Thermoleophilaceae bacterium]|jgi:hypothetical protein
MVASLLRFIAISVCAIVALGFLLFAIDELNAGSQTQQSKIDQSADGKTAVVVPPAPSPQDEAIRERQHGKVREAIDDANDVLLTPFSQLVSTSKSNWVTHGVPAVLALLVYGFGIGFLANMMPRTKTHSGGDWRTA